MRTLDLREFARGGARADFDVVVIGSGPAGIAVCRGLAERGVRVLLLEAGDVRRQPRAEQRLWSGDAVSPESHYPLHMFRRRVLGGASTVWGGRCLPYEQLDFEASDLRIGWPIPFEALQPYVHKAMSFLEAGEAEFSESGAFERPLLLDAEDDGLLFDRLERFSKPTDVWKRYRQELEGDSNCLILKGAVAKRILVSSTGDYVRGVEVCGPATPPLRIDARFVVVAAGALESARLLLSSDDTRRCGLGNEYDLVGRHYMTHLIADIGRVSFSSALPFRRLDYRMTRDGVYARSVVQLSPEVRRNEYLPNVIFRPNIPPVWDANHGSGVLSSMHFAKLAIPREYAQRLNAQGRMLSGAVRDKLHHHALNILTRPHDILRFSNDWIRRRILADRKLPSVFIESASGSYALEVNAEQYPDRNSRVFLGQSKDDFGIPKLCVNWVANSQTVEGLDRALLVLKRLGGETGKLQFYPDARPTSQLIAPQGGHHIGTLRMAKTPSEGVVDSDCEVFGTKNLFAAGASVMPTSSSVNPTLYAVALSLRLADKLSARVRAPVQDREISGASVA